MHVAAGYPFTGRGMEKIPIPKIDAHVAGFFTGVEKKQIPRTQIIVHYRMGKEQEQEGWEGTEKNSHDA